MNLEILAPAGKLAHLTAALEEGADSVYAGPRGMSGRPPMAEMSFSQLAKARELTRKAGVKLYLAVNATCPWGKQAEYRAKIKELLALNPDALIVGDLGVLQLLREFSPLPSLHASTFLGIYNAAGALWAKKNGFSRLVLNTALELPEIALLTAAAPGLVYEYIAFGGVCFNDNHRCNLPHGLRAKSLLKNEENFSREAAFCQRRLELTFNGEVINSGRLLLGSMLDCSGELDKLIASGITCFKIAGRERETAFVARAVRCLKQGLKQLGSGA